MTRLEVGLSKGGKDAQSAYIIGGSEGTRLELGQLSIEGGLGLSDELDEIGMLLTCADSRLVLEAGDGDGSSGPGGGRPRDHFFLFQSYTGDLGRCALGPDISASGRVPSLGAKAEEATGAT